MKKFWLVIFVMLVIFSAIMFLQTGDDGWKGSLSGWFCASVAQWQIVSAG